MLFISSSFFRHVFGLGGELQCLSTVLINTVKYYVKATLFFSLLLFLLLVLFVRTRFFLF